MTADWPRTRTCSWRSSFQPAARAASRSGSSSSSAVLLELLHGGHAPAAIVLPETATE